MLRRIALGLGAASVALTMSTAIAMAGQPNVDCDNGTNTPGFDHFSVGEAHYANQDTTGGIQSGNGHVVSQYDIACFRPSAN